MDKFEPIIIEEPLRAGMFMGATVEINGGISYDQYEENSTVITSASCTRDRLLEILKELHYPIRENSARNTTT